MPATNCSENEMKSQKKRSRKPTSKQIAKRKAADKILKEDWLDSKRLEAEGADEGFIIGLLHNLRLQFRYRTIQAAMSGIAIGRKRAAASRNRRVKK